MTHRAPIPCTTLATVADLKRGQYAALFPHCSDLQRILATEPTPRGGVRVSYDYGPGTRARAQVMPGTNPVQIRWS